MKMSIKVSDDGKGLSQEEVSLTFKVEENPQKQNEWELVYPVPIILFDPMVVKFIYKQSSMGSLFEIQLQGVSV